jgi:2-phospho-L-lactate guanylyltransferase
VSASPSVWAVVPTKCFVRAKSRLSAALPDVSRARFAQTLFDHVLDVLAVSPEVAGILVPTDCPLVAARARRRGAEVLLLGAPLRASIDASLASLDARARQQRRRNDLDGRKADGPAPGALVLMSDLPRLVPADISRIARLLDSHEVVVAPDERDEGTNALALRRPGDLPTCFGNEDSFARHLRRAQTSGLEVGVYRDARLGFDVDLPRHLARL